jgi:hypothetical protein
MAPVSAAGSRRLLLAPLATTMAASFCYAQRAAVAGSGNPTAWFTKVELSDGDFRVQSPYNVPRSQRFNYRDGVRTFWVYKTDKPFHTVTHTNKPPLRSHDRISKHIYIFCIFILYLGVAQLITAPSPSHASSRLTTHT